MHRYISGQEDTSHSPDVSQLYDLSAWYGLQKLRHSQLHLVLEHQVGCRLFIIDTSGALL